MELWHAVVLGVVEGITEFLPVSSTGHLILTNHLLGLEGEQVAAFDIVIQGGAILAILVLFFDRFRELLALQSKLTEYQKVIGLAVFPFLVVGALLGSTIKRTLFGVGPVAFGLILGGVLLIGVARWYRNRQHADLDQRYPYTVRHGLIVGVCQLGALWPGMSRAACTIIGGLIAGLPIRAAAELSFIVAVPILLAASAHSFIGSYSLFTPDMLVAVGVGFLVSFIFALLTVRWFMWFLARVGLAPFGWYRLVLGTAIILFLNH